MIFIRADANETIATGHIMRCMSIARAIQNMGQDVKFLVADNNGKSLVAEKEFSYIVLKSKWNDLDGEILSIKELIQKEKPEWLLIDSYYVTENYFNELRSLVKIAYIDDLNMFPYNCDMLINYSIYSEDFLYKNLNTQLVLGSQYVPLREEFSSLSEKVILDKIQDVLVLTGGADICHFAINFVNEIINSKRKEIKNIRFHIVCGRYNQDEDLLKKISNENKNIILYTYIKNLITLMQKVDIAISAGGSTLYELCACGTPTITYSFANNQLGNVEKFHKKELMYYSGDIRKIYQYDRLFELIMKYEKNIEMRRKNSLKLQQIVDGNGANRIAEKFLSKTT